MLDNFTVQIIVAVCALLGAVLGGGGILYLVVNYYLNRKKNAAETVAAEQQNEEHSISLSVERKDAFKELKEAVNEMVNEQLENQRKIMKAEQEKETLRMRLEIERSKNDDFQNTVKEILVEQGAAAERERTCQKKLVAIEAELMLLKQQAA